MAQTAFARGEAGSRRDHRGVQAAIVSTLGAALPLAVVAGTAHVSVDVLFGVRWHPTATLVLASAGGWLLLSGTTSVLTSLALTHGDAAAPMRAGAVQGILAVALTAGLVPWLGILGAGLAVTAGALASAGVLLASGARELGSLVGPTLRIAAATAIAIAVGQSLGGHGVPALIGEVAAVAATWLLAAGLLVPRELRLLTDVLARNLRPGRRA